MRSILSGVLKHNAKIFIRAIRGTGVASASPFYAFHGLIFSGPPVVLLHSLLFVVMMDESPFDFVSDCVQ